MALTLYYGSGSQFAWKVWLALEHKQLPYDFKLLSFSNGDTRKDEYLAINPRGKVPVLVDGDAVLRESGPISEYLEDRYPERPLLPKDPVEKARARRLIAEIGEYYFPHHRNLVRESLNKPKGEGDEALIASAREGIAAELRKLEGELQGDYFTGELSLVDFTFYPYARMLRRVAEKRPEYAIEVPAKIEAWTKRIDALPYAEKTTPPHWKG